jgi:hypothetical protein
MKKRDRQASDGAESRARGRRVMEESTKQASDRGERETGRRWGRARDRRVMEKSKRQTSDKEAARGMHVIGKSKR